ncbi:MAG: AmpG family muropeptide MFS transporter [Gammaproteobacteria bacterium]
MKAGVGEPGRPTILGRLLTRRMLVALLMGFSSGLPLLLTSTLLQAWLTREGINLGLIGLFSLVGLPYTLEFVWAPILDRFRLGAMGRRRGWLLVTQLALVVAIAAMALLDPSRDLLVVAVLCLFVAFCSASQDTVINAYRRESLGDDEQGFGASLYVNGYRAAMLVVSGGGLILVHFVGFHEVYLFMAALMGIGIITTFAAREPALTAPLPHGFHESVVEPFLSYLRRPDAVWVLVFLLLYKVGDLVASNMTIPFYLEMGYSNLTIGMVVKAFGFWAIIGGGLLGGTLILRIGTFRALFWFGLLQACATASFALLTVTGPSIGWLAFVISAENLTLGMSTAAFVGFMALMTDRRFTATQYALLSSLMGVPRVILSAPSGYLALGLGWPLFFIVCGVLAAPGLILLRRFRHWLDAPPAPPDLPQVSREPAALLE